MSLTILIPRPIPPGERVTIGQSHSNPACDRCLRESSDLNPVWLVKRPSQNFKEALRGVIRRDALCLECRQILKGVR